MFGDKTRQIEALTDENNRLTLENDEISQRMANVAHLLPLAEKLNDALAEAEKQGITPEDAYSQYKAEQIEDARTETYRGYVSFHRRQLIKDLTEQITDEEGAKLEQRALTDLQADPKAMKKIEEAAKAQALKDAREKITNNLTVTAKEAGQLELDRIAAIEELFVTAKDEGVFNTNLLTNYVRQGDELLVDLLDPDHKGVFVVSRFIYQELEGRTGWYYNGYTVPKGAPSDAGIKDKNIPKNVRISFGSVVADPEEGESSVLKDSIMFHKPLQIGFKYNGEEKSTEFMTREEAGYNYCNTPYYDYDQATVAGVRFVPRLTEDWCTVEWPKI